MSDPRIRSFAGSPLEWAGRAPAVPVAVRRSEASIAAMPATVFELVAAPDHARVVVSRGRMQLTRRVTMSVDIGELQGLTQLAATWREERVRFAGYHQRYLGMRKHGYDAYWVFAPGVWESRMLQANRIADRPDIERARRAMTDSFPESESRIAIAGHEAAVLLDPNREPAGAFLQLSKQVWALATRETLRIGTGSLPSIGRLTMGCYRCNDDLADSVAFDAVSSLLLDSALATLGTPPDASALTRETLLAEAARAFRMAFPERAEVLLAELERRLPNF